MARNSKKNGKGNKFLLGLGIVVLLIALFFASFWITTLSLRSNSEPDAITESTDAPTAVATASPDVNYKKMSKKELIEIIEKKEDRIKELEEALGLNSLSTQAPINELGSSSSESNTAPTAKPTAEPATKTAEPTKTSAPKPTATQKPAAPKPVATQKPAATPAPTPKPTQAPAPATKAPSIKPMAPAADSE
ncbi:MAG: hypothetical protein IKW59_06310 [Clostridia bacterium]|nr:hypothetical protein [Clostridia bacterium]